MRSGRHASFAALLFGSALLALPAPAASEPLVLPYVVESGGFQVAEATLIIYEEPDLTKVELAIRTTGLSAWFRGQRMTTMQAEILPDKEQGYRPFRFESKEQKPDRIREVFVTYDDAGDVTDLTVLSKGRRRSSDVPADLRDRTVDPLTALLQIRSWLQTSPAVGESFTVAMFDGRKLGELEVRNLGIDQPSSSQRLEGKINGIVGYDDGDRLVTLPGEPDNWLAIQTSVDGGFMPIEIRTRESTMPSVVRLADSHQ